MPPTPPDLDDEAPDDLDRDGEDDLSLDAAGGWRALSCPHCGEPVELQLDPESVGTWVEDCPVCCRPWQVTVRRDRDLVTVVDLEPA